MELLSVNITKWLTNTNTIWITSMILLKLIVLQCLLFQEIQQESSCSTLVLCKVHIFWSLSIPDQMWLPEPCSWKFSYQEPQLLQPLPLSGVSKLLVPQ